MVSLQTYTSCGIDHGSDSLVNSSLPKSYKNFELPVKKRCQQAWMYLARWGWWQTSGPNPGGMQGWWWAPKPDLHMWGLIQPVNLSHTSHLAPWAKSLSTIVLNSLRQIWEMVCYMTDYSSVKSYETLIGWAEGASCSDRSYNLDAPEQQNEEVVNWEIVFQGTAS